MSTLEQQVAAEQAAHDDQTDTDFGNKAAGNTDQAPTGQSPEEGKLFDVPRVKVTLDTSDPNVLKLAFSGEIKIDRTIPAEVDTYNRLKAGKGADLNVHAHVAGAKKTHRRDSEGNVDAVLETKSLIITDVTLD